MNIDTSKLYTLWVENKDGDKWCQPNFMTEGWDAPPEGYIYHVAEFPCSLRREYSRITLQEEVDDCDHPEEMVKPTSGWIEGVHGRKCHKCYGTQVTQDYPNWPLTWNGGSSTKLMSGTSSWSSDLVLALTRPSLKEKFRSFYRRYFRNKKYPMDLSIKIAANSCERCMNSLAHKYGLSWGYREFSTEWQASGTECDFCIDTSA